MSPWSADIHLTGSGLILRGWDDSDVPAMAKSFDEPDVDRRTPLRAPFDQVRQHRVGGRRLQLAITTDRRRPVDESLLFSAEIGGGAGPAHASGATRRRQGLAGRVVQLIAADAYAALGEAGARLIALWGRAGGRCREGGCVRRRG
ncbi:GNAT family N-acetyltransferase [Streptosporangium sp. NPDC002721]|uniref:GNAT family N-acetyltransferase n=1 Tax=Streptosporangium sp. NPDC002721 TaxID=3366188 RepID=UPI00368F83EF